MPEPWAPTEIFVGWGGGALGKPNNSLQERQKGSP